MNTWRKAGFDYALVGGPPACTLLALVGKDMNHEPPGGGYHIWIVKEIRSELVRSNGYPTLRDAKKKAEALVSGEA